MAVIYIPNIKELLKPGEDFWLTIYNTEHDTNHKKIPEKERSKLKSKYHTQMYGATGGKIFNV